MWLIACQKIIRKYYRRSLTAIQVYFVENLKKEKIFDEEKQKSLTRNLAELIKQLREKEEQRWMNSQKSCDSRQQDLSQQNSRMALEQKVAEEHSTNYKKLFEAGESEVRNLKAELDKLGVDLSNLTDQNKGYVFISKISIVISKRNRHGLTYKIVC